MDQKNSRIRRSEPLTNRTSSKVKFGKGKGGFPMPSFLSPSPLTSLSHLWRVLVKGESGSKDALRCSMGWRMWSFHKTFDATLCIACLVHIPVHKAKPVKPLNRFRIDSFADADH